MHIPYKTESACIWSLPGTQYGFRIIDYNTQHNVKWWIAHRHDIDSGTGTVQ